MRISFVIRAVALAAAVIGNTVRASDFVLTRDGKGEAEVLGALAKCVGDGVEAAEKIFVSGVRERTGVELKRVVQWRYEFKNTGKGKIFFGKARLPGTKKGPAELWRDKPYQDILMQIAGTHGFACRRDTEFPDRLYVFADTDVGLAAAAKTLVAECLKEEKGADGKCVWKLDLGAGERIWPGAKYEVRVDPSLSAVVEKGARIHDLVGLKGGKPSVSPDFEIPVESFLNPRRKFPKGDVMHLVTNKTGEVALEYVMSAANTNGVSFGVGPFSIQKKTLHELPVYGAVEVTIDTDRELDDKSEFYIFRAGIGGGTLMKMNEGYEAPPWAYYWTIAHRWLGDSLPCWKNVPVGEKIVLRTGIKGRGRLDQFQVVLAGNTTGRPSVFRLRRIRFVGTVGDVWQPDAEAFDRRMKDYEPDYSDSAKMLEPLAGNRFPKPIPLTDGTNALAVIVKGPAEGRSVCADKTAEELQYWVKRLTGVELPIVEGRDGLCPVRGRDGARPSPVRGRDGARPSQEGATRILLGRALVPSDKAFAEDLEKLAGRDGFAIRRAPGDDRTIHIYGSIDKGTMNGMYAFLENNTDLIWARPDLPHRKYGGGTVFTPLTNGFSAVWGENVLDIPDSDARGWNTFDARQWASCNRCNLFNGGGGGEISWSNYGKSEYGVFYQRFLSGQLFHWFMCDVPTNNPSGWYGTDVNGNLLKGWVNPCISSEKMYRHYRDNVVKALRAAPNETLKLYDNLGDTWANCRCKACLEPIRLDDGRVLTSVDPTFYSTKFYRFMNRLADDVARLVPGKRIATLAYLQSLPPPECEISPYLDVEFAPYPRMNDLRPLYAPENRLFMDTLQGWVDRLGTRRLEVYGYHGLALEFPRPLAERMAEDIKILNRVTRGVTSEFRDVWQPGTTNIYDASAMELWVMTRLYWNPRQNVENLRKYFIRRTFREAAPEIERFYGILRKQIFTDGGCNLMSNPGAKKYIVAAGHEDEMRGLLDAAARNVRHPTAAEFVRRLRARFEDWISKAKPKKGK